MSRRWSIAGQLLALQLGVIAVVLVGVAAVTLAQAEIDFRSTASSRVLSAAENLAARPLVRQAIVAPVAKAREEQAAPNSDAVQTLSGLSFVMLLDARGTVLADTQNPARIGQALTTGPSTADQGRAWVGERTDDGPRAVVAHVPVYGLQGAQARRVIGVAVVGQEYPTVVQNLLSAVPNLLTYLGLSAAAGFAGSLLLARRVKRQTLGLEPLEIRGLVEHREAMLTGIKEGVLALDPQDRVALVNAEAHLMLRLPRDCVGRSLTEIGVEARLLDVLTGHDSGQDAVAFVGDRILTLNRMPVSVRGVQAGSVTTMRDLTELRQLHQELGITRQTTEALRAQAHEFANRLHTISGLLELGEHEKVLQYIQRLGSATQELTTTVTNQVADPALAALLIAKSSVAAERGVRLRLTPSPGVGLLDEGLSEDLATVVGNLIDNALDAVGPLGGDVEVEVAQDADAVRVQVRDSGPGVAPDLVEEVFTSGFTTKAARGGPRGFGLALTWTICSRRGGTVSVHNEGGAVFSACLPMPSVPAGAR